MSTVAQFELAMNCILREYVLSTAYKYLLSLTDFFTLNDVWLGTIVPIMIFCPEEVIPLCFIYPLPASMLDFL